MSAIKRLEAKDMIIGNELKAALDELPPGIETLRKAIYLRRKELGVSRRLLGDACGLNQDIIWRMEKSQMYFTPEDFGALEMGLRLPKTYLLQLAGYL
jgi:hypothetical protein